MEMVEITGIFLESAELKLIVGVKVRTTNIGVTHMNVSGLGDAPAGHVGRLRDKFLVNLNTKVLLVSRSVLRLIILDLGRLFQ
jgi:hypothetical protein